MPSVLTRLARQHSALCLCCCSYVHGGQELLLNSLFVPYYKAEDFTGAAIGARHNMEVSRAATCSCGCQH